MTKQKYSSQKALFYDGFRFVIKIFIMEVDISSSGSMMPEGVGASIYKENHQS
jgi:hypothetical protein